MGLLDKAKKLAGKNKDKVARGVDKATDAADSKTGGKHTDNLQKVDDAADKYANKQPGTQENTKSGTQENTKL